MYRSVRYTRKSLGCASEEACAHGAPETWVTLRGVGLKCPRAVVVVDYARCSTATISFRGPVHAEVEASLEMTNIRPSLRDRLTQVIARQRFLRYKEPQRS